jgi:SAM-dependent methyltransferase
VGRLATNYVEAVSVTPGNMQERHYTDTIEYWRGSPHIAHPRLRDQLTSVLRETLRDLRQAGLPLDVLEVGAGHGGYTEVALAAGATVTAVDMSRPALDELRRRYGTNQRLTTVHTADGSLDALDGQFSLLLLVSVLHHIPDYRAFVGNALTFVRPEGALLSLQDPLHYTRVGRRVRLLDRGSYLIWRLGQGNLTTGVATMSRRARRVYDDTKPSDTVEYHVVRQGVDEEALVELLAPRFTDVGVLRYWSNQLPAGQSLGERLQLQNTFGIRAVGRH